MVSASKQYRSYDVAIIFDCMNCKVLLFCLTNIDTLTGRLFFLVLLGDTNGQDATFEGR